MSVGTNVVKITAKYTLRGNFLKASICALIPLFTFFINLYISSLTGYFTRSVFSEVLFALVTFLIFFPLFMGTLRFFWRMVLECNDKPISVFIYFSDKTLYLKSIKLLFSLGLRLLPIAIIVFLPVLFVWLLSQSYFYEFFHLPIPLWLGNLNYAIIFSRTIATVILVLFSLKYYIAPFLFVADENMDVAEALHISSVISRKSSLDFIYLFFSFLGWIILSIFAIPLVFTLPYMITSYLVHVRFAVAEYNLHIEKTAAEVYPSFSVGA